MTSRMIILSTISNKTSEESTEYNKLIVDFNKIKAIRDKSNTIEADVDTMSLGDVRNKFDETLDKWWN